MSDPGCFFFFARPAATVYAVFIVGVAARAAYRGAHSRLEQTWGCAGWFRGWEGRKALTMDASGTHAILKAETL